MSELAICIHIQTPTIPDTSKEVSPLGLLGGGKRTRGANISALICRVKESEGKENVHLST